MEWVAVVTSIALLQAFVFAFQVGMARVRYDVKAPATAGPEEFNRAFRIHQNTLEQLVLLVPAMWMFAWYVRADVAAGLGVLFVVGRQVYRGAYMKNPDTRSLGFGLGALAIVACTFGTLVGAVLSII